MAKIISYTANFICFFFLIVHANATKFDNQILSSIYSEYNNDYEIWKILPSYEEYKDKEINFLNRLIINQDNQNTEKYNVDSYLAGLINSLAQIKSEDCKNLNLNNENYVFEESLSLILRFWNSYCQNVINFNYLEKIDDRFKNLKVLNELYFYYLSSDITSIKNIYKNIIDDRELLSQFNFKQLYLIKNIFNETFFISCPSISMTPF